MKKIFPFSGRRAVPPLLILLLAGYGYVLWTYFVPVTGGTDQNGYHVGSWMMVDQGRYSQVPSDDFEFVGHMWVMNAQGLYYPKYPPLYPLLAATAIRLTGRPDAGFWLSPLCALLTLAGVFTLFRVFLPRGWALAGALFMAGTPVFLFYALNKGSHAPSMAFLSWGLAGFFIAASRRRIRSAWFPAMAGGLLIGYAVGIRYTDLLLLLPPLMYALLRMRGRRLWIPVLFLAGTALPCLILAGYHQHAFGAPWRTGYALTNEQGGFSLSYFPTNLRLYVTGLLNHATGPVTLFSMMGLALLCLRRPRRALLFCGWILPLFLLYNCYYWAPTTHFAGYLRFVLPIVVPLYLLALLGLRELLGGRPRRQQLLCLTAVLAVQSAWGVYQGLIQAEQRRLRDELNRVSVAFAEERVPEGSVIFAAAGLLNELDFGKRWHLYDTRIFEPNQLKHFVKRTEDIEVTPLQPERVEKWRELLVDVPRATYHARINGLIQGHLDAGRRVFLLGPENQIDRYLVRFRRGMEVASRAQLSGEIPAYLWINPARTSMRNEETSREKSIPPLRLLEITALRARPASPARLREELTEERRERLQQLYREYPEARPLLQSLMNLDNRIRALPAPEPRTR